MYLSSEMLRRSKPEGINPVAWYLEWIRRSSASFCVCTIDEQVGQTCPAHSYSCNERINHQKRKNYMFSHLMVFQITVITFSGHSTKIKSILITDRNIYEQRSKTATYKTAKCHRVPWDSEVCSRIKRMRPSNLRFFVVSLSYDKTPEPLPWKRPRYFPSTSFPIHRDSQTSLTWNIIYSLKSVITKFKSESKWSHKHQKHHSTRCKIIYSKMIHTQPSLFDVSLCYFSP
jgi:hypothetical protein